MVGNQLAAALKADRLFLVTSAPGVLKDINDPASRLAKLTRAEAKAAIADGTVRINGRSLDEPYVRNRSGWTMAEVQLGSDEYFLIGDNRGMREEEHDFGRAHRSRIVGKVVF